MQTKQSFDMVRHLLGYLCITLNLCSYFLPIVDFTLAPNCDDDSLNWEGVPANRTDYFLLKHLKSQKYLTATSDGNLMVDGKHFYTAEHYIGCSFKSGGLYN